MRKRFAVSVASRGNACRGLGQLFGTRATLADAAVMPFVRQFAMVDSAWFESQPWPQLRSWLAGWTASPLFERAMRKYEPWVSGAAGVAYPPA